MRLGNIISVNPESIRNGYPFDEIEYIDISSVGTGTLQGTQRLQLGEAPSRAKRIVRNADTLLATVRPNLRSFWFARNPQENTIASTGFAVLRARKDIDVRFLYFTVTNQPFTDYLTANAKGAAYPAVDTDTIERAEICLPPLAIQHKIASILSAYDDLVENNLRRIKILEEMAHNLYREWFVKFRFPGHQHARFTDSPLGRIPVGWEVVPLEDVCARITDGAHRSPKTADKGYPMASVKDMHDWGINTETCRKISEADFRDLVRNDSKMRKDDVLIAKDGSYLKHCFVVERDVDIALLSSIAMLRPNVRIRPHMLAMTLQEPDVKTRMKGYVSGAALPRIILKEFRKFQIILPPTKIQEEWAQFVEPTISFCWRLIDKNTTLRRTRDLLLPRLISGELDVSELGIDIGNLSVQVGAESPALRSVDITSKKKVKIETTPLPQPKQESSGKTPEPEMSDKIPAPIDEWGTNEVMAVFRSFARGKGFIEREQFIRLVAHEMGYKRVSSRIYSILKSHIISAIRRDILETESGWVRIKTSTIEEYHPNDLIRTLWSVLPKNRYSSREDTMRAAAEHLGFRRLTEKARVNIKAAMRVAIRRGILKGDKEDIWRAD